MSIFRTMETRTFVHPITQECLDLLSLSSKNNNLMLSLLFMAIDFAVLLSFTFFSRCVESMSIIYPFYVDVFSIQVRLCSGSRHPLNRSENLLLSHLRRCLRFSISPEGLSSLRWKISSAQRLSTTSVSKDIRDGACCFHSWDWTSYLSPSEVCWAKLNEITLIFSLSLV